jgi:topoisomerase-4 subunit B
MNPETLKMTTLDPARRSVLQIRVRPGDELRTDTVIAELMGKDVAARFKLITEHAHEIDDLDV